MAVIIRLLFCSGDRVKVRGRNECGRKFDEVDVASRALLSHLLNSQVSVASPTAVAVDVAQTRSALVRCVRRRARLYATNSLSRRRCSLRRRHYTRRRQQRATLCAMSSCGQCESFQRHSGDSREPRLSRFHPTPLKSASHLHGGRVYQESKIDCTSTS